MSIVRLRGIDDYLNSRPKAAVYVLSLLCAVLLGIIDHIIGPEISFSLFYTIPVFFAVWYGGRAGGLILAFLSAVVWLIADVTAGHTYSNRVIPVWNSAIRMGFFSIIALLLSIVREKLTLEETLADTDGLTGLSNSRSFYEQVERETRRAQRYKHPFTLLYVDIDNFKFINDTKGHDVGDEVLRVVARTIRSAVRQSDVTARMGGDEFSALFPETNFDGAAAVLRNMHSDLLGVADRNGWPITFSIGAVTFEGAALGAREMIKVADELMYRMKKKGKNNVLHKMWRGDGML